MTISLREITRDDLPIIHRWRTDRAIIDHLGCAYRYIGPEVEAKWFDTYLASRGSNVRLAICQEDNSVLVGVVYLLDIDWVSRAAEFAIQIGDICAQGRHLGEIATEKVMAHAFSDLNLNRVYLTVLANNHRAIGLYKKTGFIEEGRLRQAVYKNGQYLDLIQMAILREEYVHRPSCQG